MKKSKTESITDSFDDLFKTATPEEWQREQEVLLSNRFLSEIEKALEIGSNGIKSKKVLAQKVGTSPSYITQLFRNDRLINISMIVRMAQVLDLKIQVKMTQKNQKEWQTHTDLTSVEAKPRKEEFWLTKRYFPTEEDYATPSYIEINYNEDKVA